MGRGIFWLFLLMCGGYQAIKSTVDFWLKSNVTKGDTSFSGLDVISKDFTTLFGFAFLLIFLIILIKLGLYYIYTIKSAKSLFNRLLNSIIFSKMVFFDKNEVGRIINRISNDTATIDDSLPMQSCLTIENIAVLTAYPVVIAIQFPWMIIGN
jgi:ABC-type multidrug transport system fused ATPase/permease subunit